MKKTVIHYANGDNTACGEYVCGGNFHVGDIPENYNYDGVDDWGMWADPPIQHTCVPEFVTCKKCKKRMEKKKKKK